MTRSGCNTGSCHGAASGKDGFMISLFGYDPAGDYNRITRQIGMRRINLAVPEESLFVTKATGKVNHSGGKLFGEESVYYQMVLEWLEAGAPADSAPPPSVDKLEVYPPQSVIEGEGSKQRFIAVRALLRRNHSRCDELVSLYDEQRIISRCRQGWNGDSRCPR